MQQNDFLASLQQEGKIEAPVEPKEEDKEKNPPTPPVENKPKEEEKGSQPKEGEKPEVTEDKKKDGEGADDDPAKPSEKDPPFHQHPRWIAREQELNELRDFRDKAMPLLEKLTESKPIEENKEIPEWFVELFGDNDAAWKKYRAYNVKEREQLRNEIVTEFQGQAKRLEDEQKKSDQWLESELGKLEGEGLKFDRNELLKVALEYLPSDENGDISLHKAYQIMQGQKATAGPEKPKSAEEKKKVASQTMGKDGKDDQPKGYKTSADLRHKSFTDLIPTE